MDQFSVEIMRLPGSLLGGNQHRGRAKRRRYAQTWPPITTHRTPIAPPRRCTTALLQHLDAFYTAFGIKPGDPMWLAPEKRVSSW